MSRAKRTVAVRIVRPPLKALVVLEPMPAEMRAWCDSQEAPRAGLLRMRDGSRVIVLDVREWLSEAKGEAITLLAKPR